MKTSHAALSFPLAIAAGFATAQSSTATYQLTFDATWSSSNHPGAYPGGAHFSPLIGATHSAGVAFWAPGGLASPGIEQMAETGATSLLRSEINQAIDDGTAHARVTGPGIGAPDSTVITFEVESAMPLLTLVTMIAPSPDWFVGTHGLDLMDSNVWVEEIIVPLEAYDAGTDSGTTFTSSNSDTQPQQPISDFGATAPFAGLPALGTFTITLLSVETCAADVNSDGTLTPTDFTAWIDAYNNALPGCDQNNDGACSPTDFTAWLNNFNIGC